MEIKAEYVKMGKRGEIILSKNMVDSMGLKPGDILKLRSFDEYLFLKKAILKHN